MAWMHSYCYHMNTCLNLFQMAGMHSQFYHMNIWFNAKMILYIHDKAVDIADMYIQPLVQ